MSHTPGPWVALSHLKGDREFRVAKYSEKHSSTYKVVADLLESAFPEDREANAKLIAAAPDLLAALKEVHEIMMQEAKIVPPRLLQLVATHIDPAIRAAEGKA